MTHTLDCGCKAEEIFHEKDSWGKESAIRIDIHYCPTHKAAPELLAELKDVLIDVASKYTYDKACKVIDKAEGKT